MHRVALLLLIGAVAMTVAKSPLEHCCSSGDRKIVQKQWRGLFENQDVKFRETVARLLLFRVLKDYPEAKDLFKNVGVDNPNAGPFTAHVMRIFNAMDMAINLLGDPEALDEVLDHLADQHEARPGVKKDYFTSFAGALHRGLPRILDRYDVTAWKQCAGYILNTVASKLHA